jgi:hypothetical protein
MRKEEVNYTQYKSGQKPGHYESFFMRANHPALPQAFWIRYTIFSPHGHPENALGELWAIYFDGIAHHNVAVKKEVRIDQCKFSNDQFRVNIGNSTLSSDYLSGNAACDDNTISWDMSYTGHSEPLFVLPENLYEGSFPKAKLLVGLPLAIFNGSLTVNGKKIDIVEWTGSQNHNWGIKHTDHYAWGQVAGFDNFPASFFEISTARIKFGPLWTPFFTILVLRHQGKEFRLNTMLQGLKAKGKFKPFEWEFQSRTDTVEIYGEVRAHKEDFTGLQYYNPPGGIKNCINTKIASCKLRLRTKPDDGRWKEEILETKSRAAFEILTEDPEHKILDSYLGLSA